MSPIGTVKLLMRYIDRLWQSALPFIRFNGVGWCVSWGYLSKAAVAKALSSEASWKILELLVTRELGASEISKSLGIKYATVKRYLKKLIDSKAVNVRETTSSSGRVRSVYRLAGSGVSIGFPPRNHMYLSEAMINGLRSSDNSVISEAGRMPFKVL